MARQPLSSPTKLKTGRAPPSRQIIRALQGLQLYQCLPAPSSDWRPPGTRPRRRPQPDVLWPRLIEHAYVVTLADVVARYLTYLYPKLQRRQGDDEDEMALNDAIILVFTPAVLHFLNSKGTELEDVVACAWILTAPNAERATARFEVLHSNLAAAAAGTRSRPLPTMVYLFLLRRRHITASSLRTLLTYAERLLQRPSMSLTAEPTIDASAAKEHYRERKSSRIHLSSSMDLQVHSDHILDESTRFIVLIRLLENARRVWPSVIPAIAEMFVEHIGGHPPGDQGTARHQHKRTARLTVWYNRVLTLLSLPACLHPFLSVPYHQRAQFTIIRRMAEFDPALPITQEGYRAVAKVQLAHRKISGEREWARKQSRSWPPWKEDKLGIDADDDGRLAEQGVSRAIKALSRMEEAGYAAGTWEKAAAIYAGRDTDGSPTIQTRTIMPLDRPRSRRSISSSPPPADVTHDDDDDDDDDDADELWVARIRATRTIEEAWACFLARDDRQRPPSHAIYHAMFERLAMRDQQRRRNARGSNLRSSTIVLPGDGCEVRPAPVSPYEAVYVRREPPSLEALFEEMVTDGIRPSEQCLILLMLHSSSMDAMLRFLDASGSVSPLQQFLLIDLRSREEFPDAAATKALRQIPLRLFAAVIQRLCRIPNGIFWTASVPDKLQKEVDRHFLERASSGHAETLLVSPMVHICRLIDARETRYRPVWNSLLRAVARPSINWSKIGRHSDLVLLDVACWKIQREILDRMSRLQLEPDPGTFKILCQGFEKSARCSLLLRRRPIGTNRRFRSPLHHWSNGRLPEFVRLQQEAEDVARFAAPMLNFVFASLVGCRPQVVGGRDAASLVDPGLGPPSSSSAFDPSPSSLPPLTIPPPALIHQYLRTLGLLQDYEQLEFFLRWLSLYQAEVEAVAGQGANGRLMLRRCTVALRLFLEGGFEVVDLGPLPHPPEGICARIRTLVESMPLWGEWASDEEVQAYLRRDQVSPDDGPSSVV